MVVWLDKAHHLGAAGLECHLPHEYAGNMTQAEDREPPIDHGQPISSRNTCPRCGQGVPVNRACVSICQQVRMERDKETQSSVP